MAGGLLLYIGSVAIILWGLAHIMPTKPVIAGFGTLSATNRRILTMEWVAEGLALCFIGVLVLLVTLVSGKPDPVRVVVYRASAVMLMVMAVWTLITGARTPIVPIKLCPFVKAAVAVLFFLGGAG